MTVRLSSIKADLKREDEGEWIAVAEWPGVEFLVRSIHNAEYRTARDLLVQRMTRQLGRVPIAAELERELPKLYARHLLRGWRGFDEDYSADLAAEKPADPEFYPLAEQVLWASTRVGERAVEFVAAAEKNSAPPSATT